jgi:hypothetical protein
VEFECRARSALGRGTADATSPTESARAKLAGKASIGNVALPETRRRRFTMNRRNKILSGIFAVTVGLSMAMPLKASANDWYPEHHHHHSWRWTRDNDHYRTAPYEPSNNYRYEPRYAYGNRAVPADGQGIINRRNPNLYWACDSDGHHCHWARR